MQMKSREMTLIVQRLEQSSKFSALYYLEYNEHTHMQY